jgi:hypothetical protein
VANLSSSLIDQTFTDTRFDNSWIDRGIIPKTFSCGFSTFMHGLTNISDPLVISGCVNSITVSYQDPTNLDLTGFPITVGQQDTPADTTMFLTQKNFVTKVIAHWGIFGIGIGGDKIAHIVALNITTNQDGETDFRVPNPPVGNFPFQSEWNVPTNSFFLAWDVIHKGDDKGDALVALVPVFVTFHPADWDSSASPAVGVMTMLNMNPSSFPKAPAPPSALVPGAGTPGTSDH